MSDNRKVLVAIDPGANGGIVCGYSDGSIERVNRMPATPKDVLEELEVAKKISDNDEIDIVCYLEKVGGMPGQSGSAMFNFGKGYGYLEMALLALGIPTITVTPQKWEKTYQLGSQSSCAKKTEWKNKLKAKAQQLFPNEKVTLWSSDALLIFRYGCGIEK